MDRRDFVIRGAAGTLGMGVSGCSIFEPEKIHIKQEQTPIEFDKKIPKPQGSMPMAVIGTTGIKVSKFGFGSHMRQDIVSHEKERE